MTRGFIILLLVCGLAVAVITFGGEAWHRVVLVTTDGEDIELSRKCELCGRPVNQDKDVRFLYNCLHCGHKQSSKR